MSLGVCISRAIWHLGSSLGVVCVRVVLDGFETRVCVRRFSLCHGGDRPSCGPHAGLACLQCRTCSNIQLLGVIRAAQEWSRATQGNEPGPPLAWLIKIGVLAIRKEKSWCGYGLFARRGLWTRSCLLLGSGITMSIMMQLLDDGLAHRTDNG